jgi:NAD(P) transhydrogenase subunit alpha
MLAAAVMVTIFVVLTRIASAQAPTDGEAQATSAATAEHLPVRTFTRTDALLASLTIFVLAVFVGFEVIAKVPPTLHTPLMSGSNAVSGITIVGSLLVTGHGHWFISLIGMVAIVLAMINVVGGFLVTHRMLDMFKRK